MHCLVRVMCLEIAAGMVDADRKRQLMINATPSAMVGFLIACAGLTPDLVEAYKALKLG